MIRFEWRFGKLFWISLLGLVFFLSNVHVAQAASTGLLDVNQAGGVWYGGPYVMTQRANIYYVRGADPKVWTAGSYETRGGSGMLDQRVTWHGAFRISRTRVDIGMDWTQTVEFLGIKFQRDCWMRRYATYYPDFGTVGLGSRRGNCGNDIP